MVSKEKEKFSEATLKMFFFRDKKKEKGVFSNTPYLNTQKEKR